MSSDLNEDAALTGGHLDPCGAERDEHQDRLSSCSGYESGSHYGTPKNPEQRILGTEDAEKARNTQ